MVAKHKGCALVCRTRRCEFESRRHRQISKEKGEKIMFENNFTEDESNEAMNN